jgi:hypothetical protein
VIKIFAPPKKYMLEGLKITPYVNGGSIGSCGEMITRDIN